jgi:hypothetical protein
MFIVVFVDGAGLCVPMGKDDDCDGAIAAHSTEVALFASKQAARTAIKISKLFAELQTLRGRPANSDFIEGYKCLRIMSATLSESKGDSC